MLIITSSEIIIKAKHSDTSALKIIPLGGDVLVNGIEVSEEELERFQLAIRNFLNTGYFDCGRWTEK